MGDGYNGLPIDLLDKIIQRPAPSMSSPLHRQGCPLPLAQSLCHYRGSSVGFSAKTEYGIVSLIELAAIYDQGLVLQVAEIAQRQGIPDRYLEQMLTSLRRGKILRSIRGPKGGYQLARPPAEVSIAQVVTCLEGEGSSRSSATRATAEFEVLGQLAARLDGARQQVLGETTLQDLLDQRNRLGQAQVMYFI